MWGADLGLGPCEFKGDCYFRLKRKGDEVSLKQKGPQMDTFLSHEHALKNFSSNALCLPNPSYPFLGIKCSRAITDKLVINI